MRGKWVQVRATIVESPDAPPGATGPTFGRGRENHDYVVAVDGPDGQVLRATVGMIGMFVHAVGEPMAVEVNFKTGEVRLDHQRMAEILRAQAESNRMLGRMGPLTPAAKPEEGGAGSSSAAGAAGGAEQRLAQLAQLRDKGLVTESEYQAKREGILRQL